MSRVRVRVLGALGVEADDGPVALPRGRARQLLAYLALHPGHRPRAQVAAALWPEASLDLALHRLRTTVWDLRKALPAAAPRIVEADGHDIGLHPAVEVDLTQARALLEAGVAEAALELLEPGIAQEIAEDWADDGRLEVEALRLQALERLVGETDDVRVALAYARRRLALAPLSEVAHGDVIRLLRACGDRSGAMAAYERMRQVLDVELGASPSAASRRLLEELNDDEPHGVVVGSRTRAGAVGVRARPRVPYAATPLIGRDADLAELDASVRAERLVSVVGPAGVGKSRLALACAQGVDELGVPVAVAELATTSVADACDYVVAAALGVHAGPGRAIRAAILDRLELEPGVLVLDNCEHVLEPVRDLVADVLRSCRGTVVLATSREPLAVPGEQVVRLAPLPVPASDDDDQALACPAVELLAEAVRRRSPAALQPPGSVRGLAQLSRRLDGLPLALELAAARIPSVGATVLADRLGRGLDVLSARPLGNRERGVAGGRHDSLVGALEVSMGLLHPEERTLLGLVSVLPAPFPLGAAEELAGAAGLRTDCVAGVARLVDASLVESHPGDPWSYSTLQTIQSFGRTLLDDDAARSARDGLVRWAVAFTQDAKAREYEAEADVNAELRTFLPLVRAALQVARDRDDLPAQRRIITGIESWSIWREQSEVWSWITDLAAREPARDPDAEILRMGALAAWRLGRMAEMRELTARCVGADPRGAGGRSSTAALTLLARAEHRWADVVDLVERNPAPNAVSSIIDRTLAATALARSGRPQAALDVARNARRDAERVGAPSILALALLTETQASDAEEADGAGAVLEMLVEARRLAVSVGSGELAAAIDKDYGSRALRGGRAGTALEPLTRAALHWLGSGNEAAAARALRGLADALDASGRSDVAGRLRDAVRGGSLTPARLASILGGARGRNVEP